MSGWTDKSLRQDKIKNTFKDYEICAELPSVVYNGAWASISFISKEAEDGTKTCKAVYGRRVGSKVYTSSFEYEITKVLDFKDADEGNTFYRALLKTKRMSRNKSVYCDLGKALDSLPSDSRLVQCMMGA